MILALDTSTPVCHFILLDGDQRYEYDWDIGRDLADGLIGYIRQQLADHGVSWQDITAIAVYKGPGSFTGLRIGLTVMNTVADTMSIPIVGETGDDWVDKAVGRLNNGENERLVMPMYGSEPNITTPRK